MKTNLILITTWLTAEPWRMRAIGAGLVIALAIAAGIAPQEIALAGNATGGSR